MPVSRTKPIRHVSTLKELAAQADQHEGEYPASLEITGGQKFFYLKFSDIAPFAGHPFRLYTGERLSDMVDSISRQGILVPLVVRRIYNNPEYTYEMLSGHNRMNAGQIAGLEGAYCLVKENLSDKEARAYVIETNLFQRSFKDMLPSEKASVLVLQYSELFSQGKRSDIRRELEMLESCECGTCGSHFHKFHGSNCPTCGNGFHKLSRESLGETYELTGRSIANYIRIGKYLSEELKLRLDQGEIVLRDALQLSYLKPEEQALLERLLAMGDRRVDRHIAETLRKFSETGAFTLENAEKLLDGVTVKQQTSAQGKSVRIRYQTYGRFFAPTATREEIEQTIHKALDYYFSAAKREPA